MSINPNDLVKIRNIINWKTKEQIEVDHPAYNRINTVVRVVCVSTKHDQARLGITSMAYLVKLPDYEDKEDDDDTWWILESDLELIFTC